MTKSTHESPSPSMPRAPSGRATPRTTGARFVRRALAGALAAGVLALAAPAVAASHVPGKPCPTGRYWEPNNRVCVPMSPPVRWH